MLLTCLAIGLVVGLLLGGLGGGGSILTVPALVYLAGVPLPSATTAGLLIVGISSATGAARGLGARRVQVRTALTIVALGLPASIAGNVLAAHAPDALILTVLAVAMAASGLSVLRGGNPTVRHPRAAMVVAALAVGMLTGFTGAGGGFLVVPVLVGVLGLSMHRATPTSLLIIATNCVVSLGLRLGTSPVDWSVVASATVTAVLGTLIGARVTDRLPATHLKRGFAVLLLALAPVLLWQQVS